MPQTKSLNLDQGRISYTYLITSFLITSFLIIADDGAAAVLMDTGREPEVICTDLDGNSESDIEKRDPGLRTGLYSPDPCPGGQYR